MDLTKLTDDELFDHLNAVQNEQERRHRLAIMPQQLADMAARYVEDGGDRAVLIDAVTEAHVAEAAAEEAPQS